MAGARYATDVAAIRSLRRSAAGFGAAIEKPAAGNNAPIRAGSRGPRGKI